MKIEKENLHYLFVYIIFSSAFFIPGLFLTLALPSESVIYKTLLQNFELVKSVSSTSRFFVDLPMLISSFLGELKYLLFVFIACFTVHRHLLFVLLNSYRGFIAGVGCSLFLRVITIDNTTVMLPFITGIIFIVMNVCNVIILSKFSADSMMFSKKIIYPLKFSYFFKRKDTYSHLFRLLALCGAEFIITLLKIGNMLFAFS